MRRWQSDFHNHWSMKKKWGFLLAAFLLVVIATGLWISLHPQSKPTIQGNMSEEDIAVLRMIVTKDMRQQIFPQFTWKNVKNLPARLRVYFKNNIIFMTVLSPKSAVVEVGDFSLPESVRRHYVYIVVKKNNGWAIESVLTGLKPGMDYWHRGKRQSSF